MSRVLQNERSKIMRHWHFFHSPGKDQTVIDFKHLWKRQRGQKEPICGFGCATRALVLTSCIPSPAKCSLLPFPFVYPHNFLIMQMHGNTSSSENENQNEHETEPVHEVFVSPVRHSTRSSLPL